MTTNSDMTHHHQIRRAPDQQFKIGRMELLRGGRPLVAHLRESAGLPDFDPTAELPWARHPWITPILGSGPLGLPADFIEVSSVLPQVIRDRLKGHQVFTQAPGAGADPYRWVEAYVRELVKQRVGDELDSYVSRPHGPKVMTEQDLETKISSLATDLMLVAGLATRAYHRMSLDVSRPFARWGTERTEMPRDHERWQNLQDEYLTPLCSGVVSAKGSLAARTFGVGPGHSIWAAVHHLLDQISDNARKDSPTISALHIQQLTECAWHVLVECVSGDTYPGWTDLLIRLVLSDEMGVQQGHKRPRWFEISGLAERVRKIVEPAALASWAATDTDIEAAENRRFYDSIANVLWAQDRAREWWYTRLGGAKKDRASDLPQVISFVTSFDYELESALWRTAPDAGGEFSLVVPAYAVERAGASEADFVWLEGTVRVPARAEREATAGTQLALEALRTPSDWRLVASGRKGVANRHPVVVALAGCPLVELPALGEDHPETEALAADLRRVKLPATRFVHSVTVDEYLALRQTEAEWLWARDENTSAKENRGLPTTYFESRANMPERFWCVLGVPFRDPAVRLRVLGMLARRGEAHRPSEAIEGDAAQEFRKTGPHLGERRGAPSSPRTTESRPPSASRLHGLAINTRVDDEEMGVLSAIGLEVVRDRCENFAQDFAAYAAWVDSSLNQVKECGSHHA